MPSRSLIFTIALSLLVFTTLPEQAEARGGRGGSRGGGSVRSTNHRSSGASRQVNRTSTHQKSYVNTTNRTTNRKTYNTTRNTNVTTRRHTTVNVNHVGGRGRYYHPVGYRCRVLPVGWVALGVAGASMYYSQGVYYSEESSGEYVVVAPPVGAVVDALPDGWTTEVVVGNTYYVYEGTYYEKVNNGDQVGYMVIEL